jgi:hypothetical protein
MVKDLRQHFGSQPSMLDKKKQWRALADLRDGRYERNAQSLSGRLRYKSFKATTYLEHQRALLERQIPVPRAVSDSEGDIQAGLCDIANAGLDVAASAFDYERLYSDVVDCVQTFGPAVVKILVKPGGRIDCALVNVQNIYPDPLAESLADCEAIIEDLILPLAEARRRFPGKVAELNREAQHGTARQSIGGWNYAYETPNDYDREWGGVDISARDQIGMPVLLHELFFRSTETVDVVEEFWERSGDIPSDGGEEPRKRRVTIKKKPKYPKGRHIIATSLGEIIVDEDNYDPDGLFPYVMLGAYWRANQMWPVSDLFFMGPSIILYDRTISNIATNAAYLAVPSALVDPQSGITRNTKIIWPGQFTPCNNPTRNYRPLEMPPLHDSVYNLTGILEGNLQNAGSSPNEDRGFRPRSDTSGRSIEAMHQLASIRPGLKMKNLERGMSELFQRLFNYQKKYWRTGKQLKVTPRANDITMRRMMSDPRPSDVEVNGKTNITLFGTQTLTWDSQKMKDSQIRIVVEPGSGVPIDPEEEYMGILSVIQVIMQLTGDPQVALKIVPLTWLLAHAPLRDKQMIMERAAQFEYKQGEAEGMQRGIGEALSGASQDDVQAMVYQQAAGAGSGSPTG